MIVWLASFPRSGNSFFRRISGHIFGRKIYSIYPEKALVNAGELERMKKNSGIYLVKTHEMPSDLFPAIYLVRDGRDSLVSFAWFNLTSQEDPHREIAEKVFIKELSNQIRSNIYGGWSDNVLAWTQRPEQSVLVRFEDLILQPKRVVGNALRCVGLQCQEDESEKLPSFRELHNQNPYLYRKGKVGGWRTQMPESLHDLFWEKHGTAMEILGYSR